MRVHCVVRGRVQGVGFRWFVRESARAARLAGWVRNLADGSVEVAASGADSDIESLRSALRRGPSGAIVSSVDELDLDAIDEALPNPFAILR